MELTLIVAMTKCGIKQRYFYLRTTTMELNHGNGLQRDRYNWKLGVGQATARRLQ